VASCILPICTVLNPAVRGVTLWKNAASALPDQPSGPSVPGLANSKSKMPSAPMRINPSEVLSTIFECRVRRRSPSRRFIRTPNPSPPRMIRPVTIKFTGRSVT